MNDGTIRKKQLAFLEETANHYNSNNRCYGIGKNGKRGAKYSPKSLKFKNKSDGCAIGRHLPPKLALRLDKIGYCMVEFNDEFPEHLIELGISFLKQIQVLHDTSYYWVALGLSKKGIERVEYIKKYFYLYFIP